MAKRLPLIILFYWLGMPLLFAQVAVEGQLLSADEGSLSGINVIIHPKDSTDDILAYGFSNSSGYFRILVTHGQDSLTLSVRSMQYADTLLQLANRSQKLTIPLIPKAHLLEEARVEGRPIVRRGDTTVYSVQAFAQKQDFSIEDVIKKMPGFDIDDNGRIRYQGIGIQKYYIEGLDLLGAGYTLANKNLPHTSVKAVEVLHNHQPIKAAEGVINSEGTSLNIRLSQSVAVTGRAQAGAGFSPLLWDVNLTPMLFSKKQQLIASLQSNNVGSDIGAHQRALTFRSGKLDGAATMKTDLVQVPNISSPSISRNKYFDNESNLISYNHLVKLSPTTELKLNGSYYHDNISEERRVTASYFLQDSVMNIYEHQKNALYRSSLITKLSLTQNVKARYLLNELSFGRYWDKDEAFLANGSDQNIQASLPHTTIANTFDVMIPVKKNFLRIESGVDYNDTPQKLVFSPGVFVSSSDVEQLVNNRSFETANKLSFSLPVKRFVFSTSVGLDYEYQKYKTAIAIDGIKSVEDSLSNHLKWSKAAFSVREDIAYKQGGLRFNMGIPLQFTMLDITDNIHSAGDKINRLFFKPSMGVVYEPVGNIKGNVFANYSEALGSTSNLMVGNVIVNHRLMRSSQSEVGITKSASLGAGLSYQNLANGLLANVDWKLAGSRNNLMLNQIPQSNGLFIYKYEKREGDTKNSSLSSEFSWYISGIKTTLGLKGEYTKSKMDYMLSGQSEVMNQQLLAVTPKLLFGLSNSFSISYSYRLAETKAKMVQSPSSFLDQKHKLDIFIYAHNSHLIGIENELYYTRRTGYSASHSLFSNIIYTYTPSKIRVGFKLECRNLFDTDKLVEISQSDISLHYTEYYLRKRQFLLTVTWSLGRRK